MPPPAETPPETAAEVTGPIPVIPAETVEETAASPQAPLDVRLMNQISGILRTRPRWSQRPPSMAEVWEYSTTGDWTAEEKSAKRLAHGLCVLVAFAVTYPIGWAVQIARQKPIGFVLILGVLVVLSKAL